MPLNVVLKSATRETFETFRFNPQLSQKPIKMYMCNSFWEIISPKTWDTNTKKTDFLVSRPRDKLDHSDLDPLAKRWQKVERFNKWWPIGCHESPCSMTTSGFRKTNKIVLTSVGIVLCKCHDPTIVWWPSWCHRHISGCLKLDFNTH